MTKNCSQCKYWTGEAYDPKGKWRKCENPKAKQYRMYMEWKNTICKIGEEEISEQEELYAEIMEHDVSTPIIANRKDQEGE